MQNITTSNDKYATTYSIYDYTTCISVTLCHFCDIYMVFGVVQDEDGNRWIAENDNEFVNAGDAFEALKNNAFAQLDDYDAHKMCELLSELVRMWTTY